MKNRYKNKFNQLLTVLSTALLLAAAGAYAGQTTRVSVSSTGAQGNGDSYGAVISADGRYVAFGSDASNLAAGDTKGMTDTFIRSRGTGITTRIKLPLEDDPLLEGGPRSPSAISADGRYVTLHIVIPMDAITISECDVFDRVSGTIRFITDSNRDCQASAISANGRYVAWWAEELDDTVTGVTDLITGKETDVATELFIQNKAIAISADGRYVLYQQYGFDSDGGGFTFVHDLGTGKKMLVGANIDPTAMSADGRFVVFKQNGNAYVRDLLRLSTTRVCVNCGSEGISADGRFVVFGQNGLGLFVRDRVTGKATNVIDGTFFGGTISADGRYVAFASTASNLVAGDTNGASDVFVRDLLLDNTRTADLQVTMTAKPASVKRGQTASYTLTVKNNGPSLADQVNLTNIVFNGTVTSVLPNQGSCGKAAVIACHLGNLAAGASARVVVAIKANSNPVIQQVSVNAAPRDNVSSNNGIWISTPVVP